MLLRLGIVLIPFLTGCLPLFGAPYDSNAVFPVYRIIQPNVSFWVKVFSQYPSTKGILHDPRDLSVIYEVIELLPDSLTDSRNLNRLRIHWYKEKYRKILQNLAHPKRPLNEEDLRVAALFGVGADSAVFLRAEKRIRLQTGLRDNFYRGLVRSGRYLKNIKITMRKQGLPEDFAYLPHVESSFRLYIRSKTNALGLWQFMPRTGRRYMIVSRQIDERRDPEAATLAAARLLQDNYSSLGNWPLAVTAYNHGVKGLQRAKQKVGGGYLKIFKQYESRGFKFASRNFYSEFLAARYVAKNWRLYFPGLKPDELWARIKISAPVELPLEKICAHFGVSMQVLRKYNPALGNHFFSMDGNIPQGYHVYLPPNEAAILTAMGLNKPEFLESSAHINPSLAQSGGGILEMAELVLQGPQQQETDLSGVELIKPDQGSTEPLKTDNGEEIPTSAICDPGIQAFNCP